MSSANDMIFFCLKRANRVKNATERFQDSLALNLSNRCQEMFLFLVVLSCKRNFSCFITHRSLQHRWIFLDMNQESPLSIQTVCWGKRNAQYLGRNTCSIEYGRLKDVNEIKIQCKKLSKIKPKPLRSISIESRGVYNFEMK